ncbi:S-adenosyl-L-methionine-dependent methyltransferase [Xylogone sp. PMI_703]|nr:S-adenosyl-L-methionine-dependent methyltransferase [Xylogone sp. PMI_703]
MASDPTFRYYKPAQAHQYADARRGYPPALYEHILAEHAATGGAFGLVLDVGCGPGIATNVIASAFDHAVGLDPGEAMIDVARERGGETKTGEKIRYGVCEAEHIASVPGIPQRGVDMITCATSAHWFDMKKFWAQAAQVLRPGGTVAIWIRGFGYTRPDMPFAAELKEIQEEFRKTVEPYMQKGNKIAHDLYDDLELPWVADPTQTAFPKDKFQRFEWDRHGLSDGKDFFGGSIEFPVGVYEHTLNTVSAVTRWREAHPELAGTDKDCVKETVSKVRQVVGTTKLKGGTPIALLIFKRAE